MADQVLIQTGSFACVFDASLHENHGVTAEPTQHQVEDGPDIADHIRPMPRTLSLQCVVSNTPIATPPSPDSTMNGVTGSVTQTTASARISSQSGVPFAPPVIQTVDFQYPALVFTDQFDRVRDVYNNLVQASQQGFLWSITTTLASYENFALVRISAPRNAHFGNSVAFDLDFQEIRIVTTNTVTPLPSQQQPPSAKQKPQHKGHQPTQPVSNPAQQQQQVQVIRTRLD